MPRGVRIRPIAVDETLVSRTRTPLEITETCGVCLVANSDDTFTGQQRRRRNQEHTTTACRFTMCEDHCTCSEEHREQWRTACLNSNSVFPCHMCGRSSRHVCTVTSRFGALANRVCGSCCGSCREQLSTSWDCNNIAIISNVSWELHTCGSCVRTLPLSAFAFGAAQQLTCIYCSPRERCETCSIVPREESISTNENRMHGLEICGECSRCSRRGHDQVEAQREACSCEACYRRPVRTCCRCESRSRPRMRLVERVRFTFADTAIECEENPLKRAAGVELEIAGFRNPTKNALAGIFNACERWNASIGTDGSIGTEQGVEIRTSPAGGRELVLQIKDICDALKNAHAFVNPRCGLHVHVDMRDKLRGTNARFSWDDVVGRHVQHAREVFAYSQLQRQAMRSSTIDVKLEQMQRPPLHFNDEFSRLARLFVLVQNHMYSMVKRERYSSEYCRIMDNDSTVSSLLQGSRYMGLNLQSLGRHSTVEWRLHHGTTNRGIITAWTLLCIAIVEFANNAESVEAVEAAIAAKGNNSADFLRSIAPTKDAARYVGWRQALAEKKKRAA